MGCINGVQAQAKSDRLHGGAGGVCESPEEKSGNDPVHEGKVRWQAVLSQESRVEVH